MPNKEENLNPSKKVKLDVTNVGSSSDLSTLTKSSSRSSFHPSEADGLDDDLISEYKKEKPKADEKIQQSGLLPSVSDEDLTKFAEIEKKKAQKDLDKALSGNQDFYQKYSESESFINIIKQHKETVKFYDFSLAPKKRTKTIDAKL